MTGMKKTQYRIRNWPAYNAALIEGGSLTLWEEAAANSLVSEYESTIGGLYVTGEYGSYCARGH